MASLRESRRLRAARTGLKAARRSAELSEFFTRELSGEGYSGCEVRVTHARTEIIIRATHTQEVLGEKGRRIRELTSLVQKRFKFPEGSVERASLSSR